jgi:hypothetical protein
MEWGEEVMVQLCLNPDCMATRRSFEELSREYDALKKKTFKDEEVGWKGKDEIIITRVKNERMDVWRIVSHEKDRDTGRVKEISHDVPHKNVLFMREGLMLWFIEQHDNEISRKHTRWLKNWIIAKYDLKCTPQEFFGRRQEYFAKYYYCLKILHQFKLIYYESSGKITLSEYFFEDKTIR